MKILILGGSGMIGHALYLHLRKKHEVYITLRDSSKDNSLTDIFFKGDCFHAIDAFHLERVNKIVKDLNPDILINAIGITKQTINTDPSNAIEINSLFPHKLAKISDENNVKLINLSTDCIFSGDAGFYSEESISDAQDIYGRTKYLGEVFGNNILTLRKSTIGLELRNKHGLIEWWLAQKGEVKGYSKAVFSGIVSSELANVIDFVITDFPELNGVWCLASEPISKFDLLFSLQESLGRKDVKIIKDENFICDRSLDGSAFNKVTGYSAPSWSEMIDSLAKEIVERDLQK